MFIFQTFLPLLQLAAEQNKDKAVGWDRTAILNISSIFGSIDDNTSGGAYPYRPTKVQM